jgi:hypothetical protein
VVSVGSLGVVSAVLAGDIEINEEQPMRLQKWEGTIQEIIEQCGHEGKNADRILMAWRAKLAKEPTLLQPQQIDEIVREVRQRLNNPSR